MLFILLIFLILFIFQVANSNRRNNAIELFEVDGAVFSGQTDINEHICLFYENLLMEQHVWRPELDGLVFYIIDHLSAQWLEQPF